MTRKRPQGLRLVHGRPLEGHFKEPRGEKNYLYGKTMKPTDTLACLSHRGSSIEDHLK